MLPGRARSCRCVRARPCAAGTAASMAVLGNPLARKGPANAPRYCNASRRFSLPINIQILQVCGAGCHPAADCQSARPHTFRSPAFRCCRRACPDARRACPASSAADSTAGVCGANFRCRPPFRLSGRAARQDRAAADRDRAGCRCSCCCRTESWNGPAGCRRHPAWPAVSPGNTPASARDTC